MENKEDDDSEINEGKIKKEDILTKEEILKTLDMTMYKERIENIIGRSYSFLFFFYFDNIYHSKIKNKISAPLINFLNKSNKNEDSLWMTIYKSIKFYSLENLPILITKYFRAKAQIEYKFIYNESKKYTNNIDEFIDIYIKKMKKLNSKKLNEIKSKNLGMPDIFEHNLKNNIRNYISKRGILGQKLSTKKNVFIFNNNEELSDSFRNENEIKNKKYMRTQIMKQIRQLKINSIKEIEKANNIHNKQKKKYGGIKSRFLDSFYNQQKYLKLTNSISIQKKSYNINNNFNKYKEEYEICHYNSSKKSSRLFTEEKKNRNTYFYSNTLSNYNNKKERNLLRNALSKNKTNLEKFSKNNNNIHSNKVSLFTLNPINNSAKKVNTYKYLQFSNSKGNNISKFKIPTNLSSHCKIRPKSCLKNKYADSKLFLNKLEKKRNKEFFDNLLHLNKNKDHYCNKLYELFKKTECY